MKTLLNSKFVRYIVGSRTFKKLIGPQMFFRLKKKMMGRVDELFLIIEFYRRTKSTGIMVDVGVHYGESSIPFLENGWKVFGFEPDKSNHEIVMKNIPSNENFTLFDFAVAEKPGELNFYVSEESTGISSLLNFHDTHEVSHVVKVDTLNNVIEEHNIKPIKFLKIDAEGFDLFVLQGIDLKKYDSVEMIICEYEDGKTQKMGYTVKDMIDYLQSFGYKVLVCEWEPIVKYGGNHKFRGAHVYPCDLDPKAWGNLIAYKDPAFEKFALKELN
ncbi:MAG: FkbM family methyltransferase [Bacteroidetes bacterium]|nr:MAG: FkbM family methyltransferase [Bacteroidota bacterium]